MRIIHTECCGVTDKTMGRGTHLLSKNAQVGQFPIGEKTQQKSSVNLHSGFSNAKKMNNNQFLLVKPNEYFPTTHVYSIQL